MLVEAGKTTQGRTFYFALVSSPENLDRIDRYREIARRLAHPAGLTDAAARALAREGKAFVHIDGGLHSTEVAGAAAHAAAALRPRQRARPSEPGDRGDARQRDPDALADDQSRRPSDGRRLVHVATSARPTRARRAAELYQEYVGHDNNRDAYMLNMIESRVMEHTWRAVGAEHHLRAPPVVAVSDAHLAAAVRGADRARTRRASCRARST